MILNKTSLLFWMAELKKLKRRRSVDEIELRVVDLFKVQYLLRSSTY